MDNHKESRVSCSNIEDVTLDISNVKIEDRGSLKTTKDGVTVLLPQPSDDPRDPLNWSPVKKHVILFIISFAAFLPDYGSATGAVTLLPQAKYFTRRQSCKDKV